MYCLSHINSNPVADLGVCIHGQLRLIGGGNLEGRVEICLNEAWGTVCDDLWGTDDASIACKQLGYSSFSEQNTTF